MDFALAALFAQQRRRAVKLYWTLFLLEATNVAIHISTWFLSDITPCVFFSVVTGAKVFLNRQEYFGIKNCAFSIYNARLGSLGFKPLSGDSLF